MSGKKKCQVEDYVPSEWFGPLTDGSNIEGKFKTKRGLMAMKKGNLQVRFFEIYEIVNNKKTTFLSVFPRVASRISMFGTHFSPKKIWSGSPCAST